MQINSTYSNSTSPLPYATFQSSPAGILPDPAMLSGNPASHCMNIRSTTSGGQRIGSSEPSSLVGLLTEVITKLLSLTINLVETLTNGTVKTTENSNDESKEGTNKADALGEKVVALLSETVGEAASKFTDWLGGGLGKVAKKVGGFLGSVF